MKKMLKLLITMFVLYFAIEYLFYFLGSGHTITYNLKNEFGEYTIDEILTSKRSESDGYYFNVKFDEYSIPFKVLKKYNKQKRVVADVNTYYGDYYVCANITLKKDKNASDIKCIRDGIVYFYSSIKGYDTKLDLLVAASDYDMAYFAGDNSNTDKDSMKYYPNNYVDKHNLVISYYKGIYLYGRSVTGNARYISLFENDKYAKEVEGISSKYYVVPDYNKSHESMEFYSVNIDTGVEALIHSDKAISFSSFVQGTKNDNLYIIDMENKIQYTIDAKHKKIEAVGNENTGAQVYTKDGWVTKNINEVIDGKIKFYDNEVEEINGVKFDYAKLIGGENGTYYAYVKNGSAYDAYIIYNQDKEYKRNYIFSCTDVGRIQYKDGYVYYIYDDTLNVFGPNIGNRTILKFKELKFNSNINYYVY